MKNPRVRVLKYKIKRKDEDIVRASRYARWTSAILQGDNLVVYGLIDASTNAADEVDHYFHCVATGEEFLGIFGVDDLTFISTFQDGPYVFHVYYSGFTDPRNPFSKE